MPGSTPLHPCLISIWGVFLLLLGEPRSARDGSEHAKPVFSFFFFLVKREGMGPTPSYAQGIPPERAQVHHE